ncbi:hypothetical protein AVEN_189964-1 [Araneus ventricosus]|uniref:Uncharacterized protein n=1 Tax=Araneus ventricosus TaxID=182803 RepID=A0A4Y2V760_ARAVE|nr:hypothetical protein AVEN_189964-1 [Araneus ventricosus]
MNGFSEDEFDSGYLEDLAEDEVLQRLGETGIKQVINGATTLNTDGTSFIQCGAEDFRQRDTDIKRSGGRGTASLEHSVRLYLYNELPHRWIVLIGEDELTLFAWPPRSPDLTSCDFFLCGQIKDLVFVPPLPNTIEEIRERIHASSMSTGTMTLQNMWNEFDYRLDLCREIQRRT